MGYALLSHPTRLGVGGGLVGFEDAFGAGGVFGEFVWGADGAGGGRAGGVGGGMAGPQVPEGWAAKG